HAAVADRFFNGNALPRLALCRPRGQNCLLMKSSNWKLLCILILIAVQRIHALAADFLIHDGDRVVFLGDSITEQRLYTTYIEAYALTRHPKWNLIFRNVGWGGDTSWLRQRAHPGEKELFAADEATQQKMVEDAVGK